MVHSVLRMGRKIVAVAQAVDLGLPSGTKWASWNIGASTPQEYGDDYAWGELHTKTDFVKVRINTIIRHLKSMTI